MNQRIYLDNNASTFIDPRVADLIAHSVHTLQGNPSSSHSFGQQIRNQISKTRSTIASLLGFKPSELVFTSSGTEGINLVLRGLASFNPSGHIITSSAEHSCVFSTVHELEKRGLETTFLSTGLWGAVSPDAVQAAIRPNTSMIVLMAANNETGVKTDISAIAAIAEKAGIPFIVDGVALLGKEPFSLPSGVSAMCFSGHKIHAPQGIGFTFVRAGIKLRPLITGGQQEFGRRAGTENVLGILALGKAIELLSEELPLVSERMRLLRERFEDTLLKAIPRVFINGQGPRVVNVSNLAFGGVDGEVLLMGLDSAGIAASHGSACSSGSLEPSRVLLSMGIPLELVRSSIRFSFSRFTTLQEIDEACAIIIRIVKNIVVQK